MTCISRIHLDVINVKCLATMKISVADKQYASTAVCLNIANLVSVKDLPRAPTAQVIILLTQKIARNGRKRKILKIKCENNLSFPEAHKQFEQFYQARTYASAVKPGTCNKSTQTDDKSTQIDDSITENTKEKTSAQTQATQKEKSQGKSTSSSLPEPALKPATLELMRKEEEKKKKEEKEKLKKQQKDKRRKQYHKEKTKRNRSNKKSNTSSENPFSVFKKDDDEDDMDDDSVVFTDSSSSDHLPKGSLSRLQTT